MASADAAVANRNRAIRRVVGLAVFGFVVVASSRSGGIVATAASLAAGLVVCVAFDRAAARRGRPPSVGQRVGALLVFVVVVSVVWTLLYTPKSSTANKCEQPVGAVLNPAQMQAFEKCPK